MEDLATLPSTVIDTDPGPSASGGGAPNVLEVHEPKSARADLEHVFKAEAKKQADAAKPDKEVAPTDEPKADAKDDTAKATPEAKEASTKGETQAEDQAAVKSAEEGDKPAEKAQDGKKYVEPPAKMLPRAKELWRNTPREVQGEVERIHRELESEIQRHTETNQRYEQIREFDELAKSNGRDLRDSLVKVSQIENLMQQNPIAGVNAMLMEIGPRKADGQPLSLYDIAQHIAQVGPQGYQQMMQQAPQQPQNQGPAPEVQQLQQQLAAMQQQQAAAQIIEPFRAENPRYDELQEDIAFFLESGRIPATLSPADRLAAAYDMAERINPSSMTELPEPSADLGATDRRADDSFSGSKSIKSAPGSVSDDTSASAKPGESTRDSILAEMRRLKR
jgi:hypothetical protein